MHRNTVVRIGSVSLAVLALWGGTGICKIAKAAELEEVVVTAEKKSEKLQDVPIAISAFSTEDTQKFNLNNVMDLQFKTPGMVFSEDNTYASPYIRGIGTNATGINLEPSVATYYDEMYIPEQIGGIFNFFDINQVQVLKGPQGTLYGRNATGGAIVISTANPTNVFEGHVGVGFGDYGRKETEFVVNVPVDDTLRVRLAGKWEDKDGYLYNEATNQNLDGVTNYLLRGKVDWTPTDRLDVLAGVEYIYNVNDSLPRSERLGAPDCLTCALFPATAHAVTSFYAENIGTVYPATSQELLSTVKASYHLDTLDLTSITGYRYSRFRGMGDQDYQPADFFIFNTRERSSLLSEELRVNSKYEGPFNFLAGAYFQDGRGTFGPFNLAGAAFGGLSPGSTNEARTKVYSGYGEVYYELSPDWKVTLGARYNTDQKSYDFVNTPDGVLAFGASSGGGSQNFYDFTPRAVLSYKTDNGSYYISYSKGFKSGGFNTPAFAPEGAVSPEKSTSYELGAKLSFWDNRIRTNAALFHYKNDNLQVTIVDAVSGGTVVQNAASSETTGLEWDGRVLLTDQLEVGVNATLLHGRFIRFPSASIYIPTPAGIVAGVADLANHRLPDAPDVAGGFDVTYRQPFAAGWEATITATARYSSDYDFNVDAGGPLGFDKQREFTVVDLTGTITPPDSGFQADWYVHNLFEEHYLDYANTSATFGAYQTVSAPREFGVNFRYDF